MPAEPFLHISYASDLVQDSDAIRDGIVRQAAGNNRQLGITGCIAFDGRQCAQIIEGPAESVDALFSRIRRDERHTGVVELVRTSIEKLHFSDWGMTRWPIADLYMLSENIAVD